MKWIYGLVILGLFLFIWGCDNNQSQRELWEEYLVRDGDSYKKATLVWKGAWYRNIGFCLLFINEEENYWNRWCNPREWDIMKIDSVRVLTWYEDIVDRYFY